MSRINVQRMLLAAIALIMLAAGFWMHLSNRSANQSLAGISVRVGFMLAAIWLAFPQLHTLKQRMSLMILLGLSAVLVVVAVRPRLFPIAAALAVAVIFINGALRRFTAGRTAVTKDKSSD